MSLKRVGGHQRLVKENPILTFTLAFFCFTGAGVRLSGLLFILNHMTDNSPGRPLEYEEVVH